MSRYLSEPWGYCERSGAKVALRQLRKDGDNGILCDRDWADPAHPLRFPRIFGPDHMHVDPVTVGESGETWTSFIGPLTLGSILAGYANSTVRIVIAAGVGVATGTYLRLKLTAPSRVRVGSVWIGAGAVETPYAFASPPSQIRVNTSESFAIDAGATVITDRIAMTVAVSSPLVVAFDVIGVA